MHVNLGTAQIRNSQYEKLLGVTADTKLSYMELIYGKANAKLKALVKIIPFMNLEKKKILMNAFFNVKFSYCPQSWMFHSTRLSKNLIKA